MKFCSIGSGSKGNGTLVKSANSCVLVDCGFGLKDSIQRMLNQNLAIDSLDALILTHEHGDHARGAAMLARKADVPVYLTAGTYEALREKNWIDDTVEIRLISPDKIFQVGDLDIEPVPVPHDARQACQYIFHEQGSYFGLLTDVGSVTPHIISRYQQCHSIFLEFNHDLEMLINGDYPEKLKQRISGAYGHLSNQQAIDFLQAIGTERLQRLVVSHVSEQNNSHDLVRQLLQIYVQEKPQDWLVIANQENGCCWMELT